ncbi:Uncharacterized protein FWK35_00014216 [Aphis craccivora]|uniref:Uncharacterized protein n=1 Tax=Aphis craccivora TaxID=307492 RepID=A0A6G0Y7Y8_APHCR|nr:Uncharacterized protein FWK35_00014216 [Aphis craccivora]
MMTSLRDTVKEYNDECMAITTPLMKRISCGLSECGEMLFIDASGNADRQFCAGGLPVGVIIQSVLSLILVLTSQLFSRTGSIADNSALYKKKTFTYVPPTLPAELIESTSYTLDFAPRKFVQIGIDPSEKLQVFVHLLTSSRYVTTDFLEKIFAFMGHI